jgi:hypothetical protein
MPNGNGYLIVQAASFAKLVGKSVAERVTADTIPPLFDANPLQIRSPEPGWQGKLPPSVAIKQWKQGIIKAHTGGRPLTLYKLQET